MRAGYHSTVCGGETNNPEGNLKVAEECLDETYYVQAVKCLTTIKTNDLDLSQLTMRDFHNELTNVN